MSLSNPFLCGKVLLQALQGDTPAARLEANFHVIYSKRAFCRLGRTSSFCVSWRIFHLKCWSRRVGAITVPVGEQQGILNEHLHVHGVSFKAQGCCWVRVLGEGSVSLG